MKSDVARAEERLRVLTSAMRTFVEASSDYRNLLEVVGRNVAEVLGDACVVLVAEDETTLVPAAAHAVDPDALARIRTLLDAEPYLLSEHPAGRKVVETRAALLVPRVDPATLQGQTTSAFATWQREQNVHSLLAIALHAHGRALGLLTLTRYRETSPPFDENDRELAQNLADHASLAIVNARLIEAERRARIATELNARSRRAAEARFAALSEAGLIGIVVGRFDGTIIDVNEYVAKMLGHSREDLISGKVPWISLRPQEWLESDDQAAARLRETGVAGLREKEYLRADGTRVPVMLATAKIGDGPDMVSFLLDLTELRRAEAAVLRLQVEREADARFRAEVLRAKEAAELANRELEAFSYSIAHDLRAPLRAMNGYAEIMLEEHAAAVGEHGAAILRRIVANASRMAALIDGLLSLSRVTRTQPRRQEIDLSTLARSCLEQSLGDPSASRRSPTAIVVQEGVRAYGDPILVRSLLENLVSNAVKFTSRTSTPRIEIGQTDRDGEEVLYVRDNGAGFDMTYAGRLFGPFQRLHPTSEFEGTGIGLATAQRIVHCHGGKIWAEAAVEQGATFFFTLPREREIAAGADAPH